MEKNIWFNAEMSFYDQERSETIYPNRNIDRRSDRLGYLYVAVYPILVTRLHLLPEHRRSRALLSFGG